MQEKVEILINGNGPISVELLSEFEINDGGNVKKYILLTNNDIDQNGLIKILASEIDGGQIKKIESDEDWTKVKNVMRSIISASPDSITYINTSENKSFNATENYARVIAVQDSAKQAILQDYFAKRPEVEKAPEVAAAPVEDPNASIYPTDNTIAPIGSEIANGISETPEISSIPVLENEEPIADEDEPISDVDEPVVNENVEEEPVVDDTQEDNMPQTDEESAIETPVELQEQPTVSYENIDISNINSDTIDNFLDRYKAELVEEITAAVDKYVENIKLNIENQELKSIIEKLENKLNS